MKGINIGTMKITDAEERLCKIHLILGEGEAEFDILSDKRSLPPRLRWLFGQAGFASATQGENKLRPCPTGTFLLPLPDEYYDYSYFMCIKCPAGGYYSNTEGYVSDSCRRCDNGRYVPHNKAPGKREQDCIACPQGTNTESFAGFRACKCLTNFYRTDLFKGCSPCDDAGFTCADDIATLKAGYWWQWKNETHKNIYRNFTEKHLNATADLAKLMNFSFPDNSSTKFPYTLPKPYNCPREEACTGGIDSSCEVGYKGPLCGVCSAGYYKQLQACQLCPTKQWMIGQLSIITAVILIIIAVVVWVSKKKSKKREGRSTMDMILGRLKIVIGFYQVTSGLLEAFAYIKWPDSLALIGKYSEMLQLNIFQIAPIHCMFPALKVDAFGSLFAILGMNAAAIFISFSVYGIRKLVLIRSMLDDEHKVLKLSNTKTLIYKNLFFFLYISYLSMCSKTASVLSLACRSLCFNNNEEEEELCPKFLKADYSIRCDSPRYKQLGIVGYVAVGYVLILPTASLVALLSKRKVLGGNQTKDENEITDTQEQSGELLTGLRFMFENYNPHTWYWEFIETVRKVVLTSGLTLLGGESRAYVGLACVLAGLFGIFFAHKGPIRDPFENRLMVISLAVTFVNLGIGAVSRIPQEKVPALIDPYLDTIMFKTLVFGANALLIGLLCVQYIVYIYRYIKEWRKNPKWSLSCCLALLLPLNELQGEIRGMADTNITKHQLQTGDITMSTISSALKDSGVMNITLKKGEPGLEEHDTDEPTNDNSETPKHTGQVIGKNDARLSSTLKDSKVANAGHQEDEASPTEGQIKQKMWTPGGTVVTIHFAKTYDTKL